MTQVIPTTALFKAKAGSPWKSGDAVQVVITGARSLEGFTLERKSRPVKLPRSRVGMFEEPHLGGSRYWILVSTLLDGSTHDEWVSFYEGDTHSITWVGDCAPKITFLKKSPFKYEVRLSKQIIKNLILSVERSVQPWVENRLIPRRHPASLRTMPEKVIQSWINL